ncbi:MAG: hypothetical protein ABI462_01885 [Ignavibacteria bacterium]
MNRDTKILFSLFQKLDYRDKENSGKKRVIGIIAAYLFSNTIVSYNFFLTFDERSFVIMAFTSNLFLFSIIVLSDFSNLFLAGRSSSVLRTLPVTDKSIFTGKFLSAALYLLIFIFAASIPQIIFFYNIDHSISKTIAFIVSDILFCYFAAGVLILIYIFSLRFFKSKASLILNTLQIGFFIFVFYSSTLSSRVASQPGGFLLKRSITELGFVKFLPQYLFSLSVYEIGYFILCTAITITLYSIIYFLISGKYYFFLDTLTTLNKKYTSKSKLNLDFVKTFIEKYVLRNNYEIASFNLVKNELQNSRFLRIKYIPILFMPVLFVVIGLLSDQSYMLFFDKPGNESSFFKTVIPVLSPSITFILLMCSRILISNTKILDENSSETEWIYETLPIKEKRRIIIGANKFVYVFFIVPPLAVIMILLSFKADLQTVFLNVIFVLTGIYFINSVGSLFDKKYPFTLESARYNSASRFIEIFLSMILGAILFLIQIFVFQNTIFVISCVIIFVTASILLNRK